MTLVAGDKQVMPQSQWHERTDVLFCRECSWIYVYSVDDKGKPFTLKYGLGQELRGLVNELRLEHFPNHVGE